jgi:hypothetical protein
VTVIISVTLVTYHPERVNLVQSKKEENVSKKTHKETGKIKKKWKIKG